MLFIISEAKHSELLGEFEISSEAVKRGIPSLGSSNTGEDFLDVHATLSMHSAAELMPRTCSYSFPVSWEHQKRHPLKPFSSSADLIFILMLK